MAAAARGSAPTGGGDGEGKVRVDAWLWAVRLYPTRTAATEACSGGRVRIDGEAVKPARRVVPGDEVEARRADRTGTYRVVRTLTKRVGAPVAVQCYEVVREDLDRAPRSALSASWGERRRGAGRPTKQDRRRIEQLRKRSDRGKG
ncbi:RNA-binding S4 domain-containing protein [Dermatobacter hominis]|uniref:RNA-binding S4 domain-containing protein n=1 Tax=Dermatobacter hominis TaxID=2884263 RepID=UPI001D0FA038|nr:S4 domain-containing protein [Dermatobacter hominis]UDY34593.1 RNA-binding S4 domain-containing protein [Dermatobacter hominis]